MSVVHEGVPNGEKIMEIFGGDAKKKVFLYWSPGNVLYSVPLNISSRFWLETLILIL